MPKIKHQKSEQTNDKLVYPTDGQKIGQTEKMLGCRRILVKDTLGDEHICIIRKKSKRIVVGDYIIFAEREFSDKISDVIHKYPEEHIKILRKEHFIPAFDLCENIHKKDDDNDVEDVFDFEDL